MMDSLVVGFGVICFVLGLMAGVAIMARGVGL